jgi:hypothetical protein
MIKCPNCGSTTKVKAQDPYIVYTGYYFEQKCECGCGCTFTASFPRVLCAYYDVHIPPEENNPLTKG